MAAHSDTPFKRLPVKIIGTGSYVPERRLTNADLEKMVDTSHEWIIERTGIVERRIAAPDEYTSHMGTKAAQRALESCGLKPEDIDLIIVATITPDTFTPSTPAISRMPLAPRMPPPLTFPPPAPASCSP